MDTDKIDFIWLGSEHQLVKIKFQSITLYAVHVSVSSVVTCLGVSLLLPHVQLVPFSPLSRDINSLIPTYIHTYLV